MKVELYLAIIIYLAIVNMVAFMAYGIDKWKAKHSRWRTPEAVLLTMAAIGGSVGAWLGMKAWHHKTLHNQFRIGVPLMLLAQIAIAVFVVVKVIE